MVRWLTEEYKMESWVAQEVVAFQCKYEVVTVAGSVGIKIPKSALPKHP